MQLTLFLLFVALACWAFAWVRVLPSEGHLLAPLQRGLRLWYRGRFGQEVEQAWWWSPLWGCPTCGAGQLALWLYPLRYWHTYDPLAHLAGLGVAITLAYFLDKWNQPTL